MKERDGRMRDGEDFDGRDEGENVGGQDGELEEDGIVNDKDIKAEAGADAEEDEGVKIE